MGRNYKRKIGTRKYKDYTEENVEEALRKVTDLNWSVKKAAESSGIPYGTLYNKYKGLHVKRVGGQTVFSNNEEMSIIKSAITCSDWGFPLNVEDLQMITKSFLDRQGKEVQKFKNNMPGRDWVYSLLKRHSDHLVQRLASNIKRSRAGVSKKIIKEYFANLETSINGVPPSNLFNYDETNMSDDPGKKLMLYKRGKKYPENIINHSKSSTSIMFCGSASGTLLPPYVIYKSEHMWDRWTENGPKGQPYCSERCCIAGSRYNRSKSGWMEASIFTDWFCRSFLPHATRLPGKKVLIGDNVSSHFTDEVLEQCRLNNIDFICLPTNSTHISQPLDVSFFRPLKTAWRSSLLKWKTSNPKESGLKKEVFPELLRDTLVKMNEAGNSRIQNDLISGFAATGIHPFNAQKLLDKIPGEDNPNNEQFTQEYENNLVSFLKDRRFSNSPVRGPPRKKKRLSVAAGKSVAHNVVHDSETDDPVIEENITQDSSDEDNLSLTNQLHEVDETEYLSVHPDNINPGTFILVRLKSGKRRSVLYRYVAKVLQLPEADNTDYNVVGLKCVDTAKVLFKEVATDQFTVPLDDIIAILPSPVSQTDDTDIESVRFEHSIDAFEI